MDQALAEYHKLRGGILTTEKTDRPWDWGPDDLKAWGKQELRRRAEDVNRRTLLPAVGSSLLVLALTAVVLVICYHSLASHAGRQGPVPSGKSGSLPPPVPASVPGASQAPADSPPAPAPGSDVSSSPPGPSAGQGN